MNQLNKIILNNFKFFRGQTVIDIDSKNLIIYGENGSGKSSIYWALYTFLHSVYKPDDSDIQKYFDPSNNQNLINSFIETGEESSIVVEFIDDSKTITQKTLSYRVVNTKAGDIVREAAHSSDFVNYRILSRLYDFSNREQIDLFSLFEREILMFIDFGSEVSPGVSNASDWWRFLKNGMQPRTAMHHPAYLDFQAKIQSFNTEMENYLYSIVQDANEYLQNKFKQRINIRFDYLPASYDVFIEGSTTRRNRKTLPPKIILTVDLIDSRSHTPPINLGRPQSFLNEAKLTAIALSIRFAIIDAKYLPDASKILVFDDLLVSLDMGNRDIVLEIILNEFPEYQIILMTHDRMFYELAKHKAKSIAGENWLYYEMYESIKDNILIPHIKRSDSYLEKAKANFHLKEFEITGNLLRKQAEKFTKELLPKRYHFSEEYAPRNLDGLIMQCIVFAKDSDINDTIFQDLDRHRKFVLNPASHDNMGIAQFTHEIENCIKTFDALDELKFQPVLKTGEKLEINLIGNDGLPYRWEIKLEDDALLLKWPTDESQLGPVKFAHKMFQDTIVKYEWKYTRQTLKAFYTKYHNKSNKAKSTDFWDEIIQSSSGNPIRTLKIF
ncbi:AAA family ATPase [Flavobacterium aestivum]|uniref:AAA family ATPase n=1 Tax=Flavobacterium aestivum TaxID=3003257 RepID=UPI002482DA66|nr:AAA family ATPase [Flavobacterium aestivum]